GEKTYAEWMEIFMAAGNVGVDLFTPTEAGMDHPQARHNGHVIAVDDPELGPSEQIGPLVWFSATPSYLTPRPPSLQGKGAGGLGTPSRMSLSWSSRRSTPDRSGRRCWRTWGRA